MSIRKVFLAQCDGCKNTVEVPESGTRGMADHPAHWGVVSLGPSSGVFCSPHCAGKWLAAHWPLQPAQETPT